MRFLIDMPLTPSLSTFLQEHGHDAIHAADIGAAQPQTRRCF
jgi:predicted nuclease of predicted toxin-antitoxin system